VRIYERAFVYALVCGCSTQMTAVDSGNDVTVMPMDASSENPFVYDSNMGMDVFADCGQKPLDAGICAPTPVCSADPPADMQQIAKCNMELEGGCGVLYANVVKCNRVFTVCEMHTCKTDPIPTGTSIMQNCAGQNMAYSDCLSQTD